MKNGMMVLMAFALVSASQAWAFGAVLEARNDERNIYEVAIIYGFATTEALNTRANELVRLSGEAGVATTIQERFATGECAAVVRLTGSDGTVTYAAEIGATASAAVSRTTAVGQDFGDTVHNHIVACSDGSGNERIAEIDLLQSGGGGGGGSSSNTGLIIGGVVAVGGLVWLLSSGGNEGAFSFTPDFAYSATESGYSASAGGRMDFVKDRWHLYYAGGGQSDGGFHYESGGEYAADFWTAAFSESVSGNVADYDFSLSTDVQNGIWNLSPIYRFHSELDLETSESESRNSLNVESVLRMNRWTIRPTAGFTWRGADEFGENAEFGISAIHRF